MFRIAFAVLLLVHAPFTIPEAQLLCGPRDIFSIGDYRRGLAKTRSFVFNYLPASQWLASNLRGTRWRNGTAVYWAFTSGAYRRHDLPPLLRGPSVYAFGTYSTLIVEGALFHLTLEYLYTDQTLPMDDARRLTPVYQAGGYVGASEHRPLLTCAPAEAHAGPASLPPLA